MSCRLFSAASVSFPSSSPPPSPSSFAIAVVLVWHRSARSNLINSCKFNYWFTASRISALCIFFSLLHAQVYLLASPSLFLLSSFSLSPWRTANKPISAFVVFANFHRLQFLGETLWGTRLLVNGRMWDPGSTYMGIRGLNEFQRRLAFCSRKCENKTMCMWNNLLTKNEQNKNYVLFSFVRIKQQILNC